MPLALAVPIVVALAASFPARADEVPQPPPDTSTAQALFDAGRELMDAGHYAEACAKFEQSNKLDPSAGTLLNFGKCLEAQGRTASAWAMYKQGVSLGRSSGKERHVEVGEELIAAIEPRLVKLTIDARGRPPGLEISRVDQRGERVAVTVEALGLAVAVDPSTYTIDARAPGRIPWSTSVVLDKDGATARVDIPELAPLPAPAPPRLQVSQPLLIGGIATAGAGVVALAIGTAFGVFTLDDSSRAETDPSLCPKLACSPKGLEVVDAARTESYVSTAALTIGGAAAAAGGAMIAWALLHRSPAGEPAVSIAPLYAPRSPSGGAIVGVVVGGAL